MMRCEFNIGGQCVHDTGKEVIACGTCPYSFEDGACRCAMFAPHEPNVKMSYIEKRASWQDVAAKGRAIVASDGVEVIKEDAQEIEGWVMSGQLEGQFNDLGRKIDITDGGPYDVILSKKSWEKSKNVGGWIQGWICDCIWGSYFSGYPDGYGYHGRFCSHAYALMLYTNMRARKDFMGASVIDRENFVKDACAGINVGDVTDRGEYQIIRDGDKVAIRVSGWRYNEMIGEFEMRANRRKTADSFVDNEVINSIETYIKNNDLDPYGYPSDYDAVVDWATKQYELYGKPNTPSKHINDIVEDVLFMLDGLTASKKTAALTIADFEPLENMFVEGPNVIAYRYVFDKSSDWHVKPVLEIYSDWENGGGDRWSWSLDCGFQSIMSCYDRWMFDSPEAALNDFLYGNDVSFVRDGYGELIDRCYDEAHTASKKVAGCDFSDTVYGQCTESGNQVKATVLVWDKYTDDDVYGEYGEYAVVIRYEDSDYGDGYYYEGDGVSTNSLVDAFDIACWQASFELGQDVFEYCEFAEDWLRGNIVF